MYINGMSQFFLNTMRHNQTEIYKSMTRLSIGRKLASDNPADIIRSSRLETQLRGNVTGQRNIKDGLDFLKVAGESLSYLDQMGQRLRELSNQYQTGTLTDTEKSVIQEEAKALTKEMSNIMSNSKYNNKKVFDLGSVQIQAGANKEDRYELKLPVLASNPTDTALSKTVSVNPTNENRNVSVISNNPPMVRAMVLQAYGTTYQESNTIEARATDASSSTKGEVKPYEIPAHTVDIPNQEGFSGFKRIYGENGKLIYEGNLTNGQLDGYGQLYDKKGQLVYEGDFNKGIYDGYGSVFNDGKAIYRGDIKNGVANGHGTFFDKDGGIVYKGDLKEGYREGWGNTFNSSGEVVESKYYTDYTNSSNGSGTTNPPDGNGDGGTTNPPDGNGNGGTTNPPDGNGDGGTTNPPDGNGNGGTTNPPDGNGDGGTTNPPDGNGDGGTTNPPDGNGDGGTTNPPDIDLGNIGNIDINDLLNNDETLDYVLDQISVYRGQVAIHESILERRLGFQESMQPIQEEALGHINDVDIAKEMIAKSKLEMLQQMNAQLMGSMLEQEKAMVSTLVRSI
jgi:flagellin-like hook-associated protein FlgL